MTVEMYTWLLPPFIPKYMTFLCPSSQTAQFTVPPYFPCSCPPPWLQCSDGQLSAPGGWAVQLGSPGSGHIHLPAAALPRYLLDPSPQPNCPSPRSPFGQNYFPCCGFARGLGNLPQYHWSYSCSQPCTPCAPSGPQPPHFTSCCRLRGSSRPGPGVSAGRTQLRRGALWHHGPAYRTAGAEGPRPAHRLQVRGSPCSLPLRTQELPAGM